MNAVTYHCVVNRNFVFIVDGLKAIQYHWSISNY